MSTTATLPWTVGLMFASGRWTFRAAGGEVLRPVLADPGAAQDLIARLRQGEAQTGRTHVVCGLIPFDTRTPALLRLTDAASFEVRSRPVLGADPSGPGLGSPTPPDDPAFRLAVERGLEGIAAGSVDKVVLSRTMHLGLPPDTAPRTLAESMAQRLEAANPLADVFLVDDDAHGTWVGASPEIVADVRHGRFLTHPLAGSLPGTVGRAQARELLEGSAKDLREHAFVVEHIRGALSPLAEDLQVPSAPELFATDSMWHLGTRITGQLHHGVSALEAALALHPTPAVCGTPTAAAARLIDELEPEARGFYAGLVGWSDSSGDGRWSLLLRGAHVSHAGIRLRTGAGIVSGSDPAAEHAETAAKFGTVLRSLEGLL